jgi:hypothetical protein
VLAFERAVAAGLFELLGELSSLLSGLLVGFGVGPLGSAPRLGAGAASRRVFVVFVLVTAGGRSFAGVNGSRTSLLKVTTWEWVWVWDWVWDPDIAVTWCVTWDVTPVVTSGWCPAGCPGWCHA